MRHIRLPSQSIKTLSIFKKQMSLIINQLNKFSEREKKEAFTYIQKTIPDVAKSSGINQKKVILRRSLTRKCKSKILDTNNIVLKKKTFLQRPRRKRTLYFECNECSFRERIKSRFLKHIEAHVGSPMSCIKCRKTFNSQDSFSWHQKYLCKKKVLAKGYTYKCDKCSRGFSTKQPLKVHIEGHKRNSCPKCNEVITNRKLLIKHLREIHSIKLEREYNLCKYCDKKYIKKFSLYSHLAVHFPEKIICLDCGFIADVLETFNEHKKMHDVKKYFKCKQCNQKFSRRNQYLHHLRSHDRYKCITCDEKMSLRQTAIEHQSKGHLVDGFQARYLCPLCPNSYYTKDRLHFHLLKHPENKNILNCKICKKTFHCTSSYYKHCSEADHKLDTSSDEIFPCDICKKDFINKKKLDQHKFQAHAIAPEPFRCKFCDHTSLSKTNLEKHARLHFSCDKKFMCEKCGKTFTNNSSFVDHISFNHAQAKQFHCNKCGKEFKRKSELVRHQASHSNNRPYVCIICENSYKQATHLRRHEQSAHKIFKRGRKIQQVKLNPDGSFSVVHGKDVNFKVENKKEEVVSTLKPAQSTSNQGNLWSGQLISDEDILMYAENNLAADVLTSNDFDNISMLVQYANHLPSTSSAINEYNFYSHNTADYSNHEQ